MTKVGAALRRALRHPGLILAFFCLRVVFAAAGALLWLEAFAPAWVMGLPRKDASLFQPGLQLPIRLFVENRQQWGERAKTFLWLALAFLVASAVVTAFVLHAMNRAAKPDEHRQPWPTLQVILRQVAVVGVSWVIVLLAIYIAQHLASILPPLTYQFFGEKGADAALVAIAILLLATIVVVRIGCDLTRTQLSYSSQPLADIVARAATELHARWGFWVASRACFTLPTLGLALLAQIWFPCFGDDLRFGFGRLLAHQAVVLVACGLQVGWWALVLTHGSVPYQAKERQDPETR